MSNCQIPARVPKKVTRRVRFVLPDLEFDRPDRSQWRAVTPHPTKPHPHHSLAQNEIPVYLETAEAEPPARRTGHRHNMPRRPSAGTTSASPDSVNVPPRPRFRLARCSQHGQAFDISGCSQCANLHLDERIAHERSAPPCASGDYIGAVQPLCLCDYLQRRCFTCELRAKMAKSGNFYWV